MTIRVSPLGLAADYSDGVKTAVQGSRAIGPMVLPYTQPEPESTVELVGASAPGQAGVVTTNIPITATAQLGPRILPSPIRNLQPKAGDAVFGIIGAGVQARGEEMEGADVLIIPDTGTGTTGAGTVAVIATEDTSEPTGVIFITGSSKSMIFSGDLSRSLLTGAQRSIIISGLSSSSGIGGASKSVTSDDTDSSGTIIS